MECHADCSGSQIQKGLLNNSLADPRINNEWIANFLKRYADLSKEIEDLQMLQAIMEDNERREKVTKSQNKQGRKRAGIPGSDPQSIAQIISSRNIGTTTTPLSKEAHFHAKKR